MNKIGTAIVVCAGLFLFASQAALAQPMRCSGERNTCITTCKKNINLSVVKKCTDSCHVSQSICMRTGCWDTGTSRYCGLMKQ